MEDKYYLLIFGYYPKDLLPQFKVHSKGGLDIAANNLQEAIIKGFEENKEKYHVINAPFLGSFPLYYKSPFVLGCGSASEKVESISYANITYLKRKIIERKVTKKIIEFCRNHQGCDVNIIFYNTSCIKRIDKIKELFPSVKIQLLVTDLPEFMATDTSLVSRVNDKMLSHSHDSFHKYVDGYILLAEKMKDRLPSNGKPYIIVEGIWNKTTTKQEESTSGLKIVMYTGNLGRRYGIINLLKAFSLIKDPSYHLWIRGNGGCEELVKEYSEKDNRIVHIGKLEKQELLAKLKQATILINPVSPKEEFTKYFFPSKTMEYMASGTPTVMFSLQCLPGEYKEHLYFIEEDTPESIQKTIVDVCSKSQEELNCFGKKASEFIKTQKNANVQCSRILKLIGFNESNNLIYVGSLYPEEDFKKQLVANYYVDFASQTFQTALSNGLMAETNHRTTILTAPDMPSYPTSKQTILKKKPFFIEGDNNTHTLTGFLNLPLIKLLSKMRRMKKAISNHANANSMIVVYGLHSPFLLATAFSARRMKKCVVVPDLPEFMTSTSNRLVRFAKSVDHKLINYALGKFDYFVLLSPFMKDRLNIGSKKWIQLEGIYKEEEQIESETSATTRYIFYSGDLGLRYGIGDLLESFHNVKAKEIELWICGKGEGLELVKEYCEKDKRIKFLGFLPREKVVKLQQEAILLVNPRHSNEIYTEYSFPSKTIEYMASGTPVVMCKLKALPQDYHPHLYFFEDESVEGMTSCFEAIIKKSEKELKEKGRLASEFIQKSKNPQAQVKRIIEFGGVI